MEYRIFGPGGTPTAEFRQELREFFNLDEAQRAILSKLFLSEDFDFYDGTIPPAVVASSLLPEQFSATTSAIAHLLVLWREYDLQLVDVERDLLLLGYTQVEIEAVLKFLEPLSNIKERVWASNYTRVQRLEGLPTIDNLNIICDARAVFGGFPEGADRVSNSYKDLLSLTPIVIMEIISSDNYGRRQRTAFQLTEDSFERFRKIIVRAQEQVAILKERIATTSPSS